MLGIVTKMKNSFGFIAEEGTEKVWYFNFSDLIKFQTVREGAKVSFERKNGKQKFKEDLNNGLLRDSLTGHRNPTLRKTARDVGFPKAPAAHKVEILVELEAQ
jgi:cold shock CspA family protein